jgi:hypothetical protein
MSETEEYVRTVYGNAQIVDYSVELGKVTYTVLIRDAILETADAMTPIADVVATHIIHFTSELDGLTKWMEAEEAQYMEQSWREKEANCYFEKREHTYSAHMTLGGGYSVLVPLPMPFFFAAYDEG